MSLGETLAREFESVPTVKVVTGLYVGAQGSQVIVSLADVSTVMPLHSAAWPMPGERVVCVNLDGHWMCFGPEQPRQQWGVVLTVGATTASVEYPPGSGVTADVLIPRGDTPAAGDFALLDWANGGVIVRLYGGEPAKPPPAEPTAPATVPQTRIFRAVDAGTADGNGAWISDILFARTTPQGAAAWFHGSQVADTVAGKTVLGGRIYVPIRTVGSGDILLGYHTLTSRSGVPGIAAGSVEKPTGGWHTLPLPVAQALAATGRGVSFRTNSGGAPSYKSLAQDPLSGQVEITYR